MRRSTSETDLLVSEEEVNQTFACWKEDLVGITGLYGPVVDELLLANVRDHGWDTGQYLSVVLVAGFEESERKTSEAYRKVFARARLALPCAAPRGVVDVCLVCRERVLGDAVGPHGHRLHSACLAEGLRVQVRGGRNRLRCPNEWLKYQCGEGHTLSGIPDSSDLFTVTCLDGDHTMTHCKPVQCGVPPVIAHATPLGGCFVIITYGKQVEY